jgi:hypothetical protein
MRKVISVEAFDHFLVCNLDDGNTYMYDMSFILKRTGEMVLPLRSIDFFKRVFIDSGALAWPNDYNIRANTIERDGHIISKTNL